MKKQMIVLCLMLGVCLSSCRIGGDEAANTAERQAEESVSGALAAAPRENTAEESTSEAAEKEQEAGEKENQYWIVEGTAEEIHIIREKEDVSFLEVAEENPLYTTFDGVLYDKEMKTLVLVPREFDRKTFLIPDSVEEIGDWAFYNCQKIETVVMGSNVKEIGSHAFYGCKALREIHFSETAAYIGNHAFEGCAKLEEILLPDSVLPDGRNYMTTWAIGVFDQCSSLKKVRIPCDTVLACLENLSCNYEFENTFRGCDSLEEFIISERAENVTVYNGALASSSLDAICRLAPKSGVEAFTIPSQTAILGAYAFENCTDLKELMIEPYEEAQDHSVILATMSADDAWRRTIWIDGETTIKGCSELERLVVPPDVKLYDITVQDFPKLTIYAEKGSAAAEYAEENGIPIRYISFSSQPQEEDHAFDTSVIEKYFLGIWEEAAGEKFAIGSNDEVDCGDFFGRYGLLREAYLTDESAVLVCQNFISDLYRIEVRFDDPNVILVYDEQEARQREHDPPREYIRVDSASMYTDTGVMNSYLTSMLYLRYGYLEPSTEIGPYSTDSVYFSGENVGKTLTVLTSCGENRLVFISAFANISQNAENEVVYIRYEKIKDGNEWVLGDWSFADETEVREMTDEKGDRM